jgi:hypothetical protein
LRRKERKRHEEEQDPEPRQSDGVAK